MDIVISNSYLAVFSAGTIIGATSAYFAIKFKRKTETWTDGQEEKFEFGPDPKDEYRLILGVRNDLKMQKGKVAAQCGHAAVAAYAKVLKERPRILKHWMKYGGTKIALRVDSEQDLLDLDKRARAMDVLTSIVRDAGQTQVAPGTRTVIAIGPAPKSVLEQISGHLKLY